MLSAEIFNRSRNIVAQTQTPLNVPAGNSVTTTQTFTIADPEPWSPESPALYDLKLRVFQESSLVDRYELPFGIRTAEFSADRGFLLNGTSVKLKGVADHYCAAGVGAAIPDALLEWQLRLLKAMGVNAIRTAHHPRPPRFLRSLRPARLDGDG